MIVPILGALSLLVPKRPRVAEVHSWFEEGAYRMLIVVYGRSDVLRAGITLDKDVNEEDAMGAARVLLRALKRRVRFTDHTVFIPEGKWGLNGYPA